MGWGLHSGEPSQKEPEKCDVYVWGSNSSYQLAEERSEKVPFPKKSSSFTNVRQVLTFRDLLIMTNL